MRVCYLLLVLLIATTKAGQRKRGVFSLGYAHLPFGVTATYGYALPISYSSFISSYPISNYLDVQLQPAPLTATATIGAIEKPVTEPSLEPPPPTSGASITVALPQTNVYSLGSGSLGAVQLNDGRLALGSGSLGYTQRAPTTGPPVNLVLESLLQQNSPQQPPPSYINDRRPQSFGLGALPVPPQQTQNPPPPETRGYASTPGLSSAAS